jgi:hypothetical protein
MTNDEIRISFNEMLDDVYGDFYIAGMGFSASTILATCDPIAYEQGLLDYEDSINEMENE